MFRPGIILNISSTDGQMSRDKDIVPLKVAILAAFFVLSVQVFVPNRGQELVPIAEMDKNIFRLPIR